MVFSNCLDDGGANQNERTPGNGDDGVPVWAGEIAIDPTGHYLVTAVDGRLFHGDLSTGETRSLSKLKGTLRLAFDHGGASLFATRVTAETDTEIRVRDQQVLFANTSGARLVRYDVARNTELWSQPVNVERAIDENDRVQSYPNLEVTKNDELLIVTHTHDVELLAADSGKTLHRTTRFQSGVVDVDLTPDQTKLVVTLGTRWEDRETPRTRLEIFDLETFESSEVEVPNCAAEVAVTPDGRYALLAPTKCEPPKEEEDDEKPVRGRDPVSVIDLERGEFIRNLPGFGPVALAQQGALAVAFMDTENLDRALFDDPSQIPEGGPQYRLMLIDTTSLTFETIALGDDLPRYAVSPDGQLLLVDSPTLWHDGRVRILDTQTRELAQLAGPGISLENYVMTRDSSAAFLLSDGLFKISLPERRIFAEPIPFSPFRLNITPDDRHLVLRETDSKLWLYDVETSELTKSFELEDPSDTGSDVLARNTASF